MKRAFLFMFFLVLAGMTAGFKQQDNKGINSKGEKMYLGSTDIETSEAFKNYKRSPHGEADKQRYLFERLKNAKHLEYYHDGSWYNSIEAYRGGMWLMRNRYKKDFPTRDFIKQYVERSEEGNLHLAKYPDGSTQIGSYVLYNELDLLELKSKK